MSRIRFGSEAEMLLREEGILVGHDWAPRDRTALLGIATVMEAELLLLDEQPAALLLLAERDDEPPTAVLASALPCEVAYLPTSSHELQRRARWLAHAVDASPRASPGADSRLHRLATAGRVAATVAHEVGNALACTVTNVDFLAERISELSLDDPELLAAARQAQEGVHHALEAQRLMLELSRDHVPLLLALDLNAELARGLELARAHARRRARVDVELGVVPRVMGDRTAIVQVLMNLLANASDAAGRGGRVLVRTWREGRNAVLAVADDGPGIPEAVAARLFEAFATGKGDGGNGLGLAVSRELVERLGGTIEVGRGPLGGAEFRVVLRCARSPAAEPVSASARRPAAP